MNNLSSTPEFPKFPIEEFKEELEQGHAEFKSAIQKLTRESLAQLNEQNPELMAAQITKQNDIQISIILGRRQPDGVLLEHLQQIRDILLKDLYSQIEEALGRLVTPAELTFSPASIPLSDIKKVDQMEENYELAVAKGQLNHNLAFIDENIPKGQTTRPDIKISLYMPSTRGLRIFIYVESNGIVMDHIFRPPTVTLDTSVVIEWWKNQAKVEHVETLIELGKKFEIDLAVTGRIHDDVPDQPLAAKINDLPNLLIDEIGAIIRIDNWKPGIDTGGITEFVNFIGSIETSDKFDHMSKKRQPGWCDWDHIHTHYRYGRNYFLTWDRGILHFHKEFEDFGISVMKPEDYLSQHQKPNLEEWVQETMCNSLQTDTSGDV